MSGNVFAAITIPWFVLPTTHSPAKAGITGFFNALGSVLAAFFGGAIVDRLGFKRTSVVADLASGVAVALIPILYMTVGLQYWQLLVLVFVGNLLDAPGNTARDALTPDLAGLAGLSLEQAGAAIQAVERGARMVGAPLAGLFIALAGTNNVLWFDAISRIPVDLRGRVLGTVTAISWIATPLGVLLGGYLLEVLDVRAVLVLIGAVYVTTLVSFLFNPAMRQMNAAPAPGAVRRSTP